MWFFCCVNLISDILFLHTDSLKSRCFLFIFIILVFILDFRLARKLVFLYFNVNVFPKEIPCLNKVTLPYPIYTAVFGTTILGLSGVTKTHMNLFLPTASLNHFSAVFFHWFLINWSVEDTLLTPL